MDRAARHIRPFLVVLAVTVVMLAPLPVAQAQEPFAPGAIVALQGTPHLWIADGQGVLHWGGDTRALAGRHVNWGDRTEVSLAYLRTLPVGDPWLSAGLLKDGDPIYLVKWEIDWAQPRLLHIQSIADVEIFGINGGNYGNLVLDRAAWEARYGISAAGLQRGVLPAAVPSALTAVVVPAGGLNVRRAPRADAAVAYVAPVGATLTLTGSNTVVSGVTWWQVNDGNWVQGQYLRFVNGAPPPTPAPTPATTPGTEQRLTAVVVPAGGLNVRTAPRADAAVAYVAPVGATLTLTGTNTVVSGVTWWQVNEGNWVQGQYLRFIGDAPPTPPTPPPTPTLPNHPDAALVRDTAIARGAFADQAVQIAIDVIGRGTVDAFLRGEDVGALYGVAHCQYRSPQCPLAPDAPPALDPALVDALDLLAALDDRAWDNSAYANNASGLARMADWVRAAGVAIVFEDLPEKVAGRYSRSRDTIAIDADLRHERLEVIAAVLAHEIVHAVQDHDDVPWQTPDDCYENERKAFTWEAAAWELLGWADPQTDAERSAYAKYLRWKAGDYDDTAYVRSLSGYQEQCERLAA